MNYSFEYIDIILLAMIAGFIFLRLRGILGKRTGYEGKINPEFDNIIKKAQVDNNLKLKENFDDKAQSEFLKGAKIAYETIITDFSDNDNKIVASKPLLSKKIYDQFQSPDRPILEQFQDASWEHRLELIHVMEDPRYRQLGMRLIACHAPHLLSNSQSDAFFNFIRDRWASSEEAKWETADKVTKWITENGTKLDQETLENLNSFYSRRLSEVGLDFPTT